METDVDVEIPKTGFPHRLAKRLLAFRTVPTGPAAIKTNPQGWAKSNDQSGPNQVDKTTTSYFVLSFLQFKIIETTSKYGKVRTRTSALVPAYDECSAPVKAWDSWTLSIKSSNQTG